MHGRSVALSARYAFSSIILLLLNTDHLGFARFCMRYDGPSVFSTSSLVLLEVIVRPSFCYICHFLDTS